MTGGDLSNEAILDQLRIGGAEFQLVSASVPSISSRLSPTPTRNLLTYGNSHPFFARIGPSLGGVSPAMKKLERYSVQRITGDGRCMFRALVKGMAINKGIALNSREERDDADDLRMAVKEVLCDDNKEQHQYEEALIAITVDEPLKRYCQRIGHPDFWGGESELLHFIAMATEEERCMATCDCDQTRARQPSDVEPDVHHPWNCKYAR